MHKFLIIFEDNSSMLYEPKFPDELYNINRFLEGSCELHKEQLVLYVDNTEKVVKEIILKDLMNNMQKNLYL